MTTVDPRFDHVPILDHVVLAAPDLAVAVADFTSATGVQPAPSRARSASTP